MYVRCPTCGRILTTNFHLYQADLDAILDDPKLEQEEKDEKRAALLDKYGYELACCRQRVMGYIPYERIVVT